MPALVLARRLCLWSLALGLPVALSTAWSAPASGDLQGWLARMVEGSRVRAYVGTFVVSSGSSLSSARIWHVCEGAQQVERVDALTGPPRSVFRHNDQVLTLWPNSRLARSEQRPSLGLFPERLRAADARLAERYRLEAGGLVERVAGVPADVVWLQPRDRLRYGYRAWVAQQSGLVLKLQTLDPAGQVLEQSAFSELQLDAPLKAEELLRQMSPPEGYRLERLRPAPTTLAAQGWGLREEVAGFALQGCHQRSAHAPALAGIHCVFSDGLASVSLFLEPQPGRAVAGESLMAMGATHTLRTGLHQHAATFMGEVPPATLRLLASALERRQGSP